jgi:hypothetical protein
MNESVAAKASAMTSATFTAGTIHLGARAGTRTTLASIIDCLIRSALKLCSSRKGVKYSFKY